MKKVILSALFLGTFITANAVGTSQTVTIEEVGGCHEYACSNLDGASAELEEMGLSYDADALYEHFYDDCITR